MSHLDLTTTSGVFHLNVLKFEAPVYQQIQSGQTKTMQVHFPIKIQQPTLQLTVVFDSQNAWETFQGAIRRHQTAAAYNANLVTLNWPERSIINWSGVIKRVEAGGRRFNYAPETTFEVDLVDSLASARTEYASIAANWQSIFGLGMPGLNNILAQPGAAEIQNVFSLFGINMPTMGILPGTG